MTAPHCIVVAWTTTERRHDGAEWQADIGKRPRMVDTKVTHAVCWVNEGDETELTKARAWAEKQGADEGESARVVFVYPVDEADPLGRARKEILR